ncbi:DNL zinc finger-domain-containing protein [Nemania diffusa]|nr:DNL zinc finger-domain-containing protein [Nemania diffusa]
MASLLASRCLTAILRAPKVVSTPFLRPYPGLPRTLQPMGRRLAHTIPKPTRTPQAQGAYSSKSRKEREPHYELRFTCVPCGDRSAHTVSKQGYHHGSVLITCPVCRNRHVISDNLNIFGDRKITVEDLLREKGQLVKRGTLGEDGDIEFWPDASTAPPGVAEAGAASAEGEGEGDEARRLRETRDPSSQTTDPTPLGASSVLPGGTGARPSTQQSVSHQSPTPSTRRQYHIKKFQPPTGLRRAGAKPVDQTRSPPDPDPEPHTSRFFSDAEGPYDSSRPEEFNRFHRLSTLREELSEKGDHVGNDSIPPSNPWGIPETSEETNSFTDVPLRHGLKSNLPTDASSFFQTEKEPSYPPTKNHSLFSTKSKRAFGEKHGFIRLIKRLRRRRENPLEDLLREFSVSKYHDLSKVRRVENKSRIRMVTPEPRMVLSDVHFKGPRFVETNNQGYKMSVQLQPGVVLRRRPPGGVPPPDSDSKSKSPDDSSSEVPINHSQRRGFFRPSFLPVLPDPSRES